MPQIAHYPTIRSTLWYSLRKVDDSYEIVWLQGERLRTGSRKAVEVGTDAGCRTELDTVKKANKILRQLRSLEKQYA